MGIFKIISNNKRSEKSKHGRRSKRQERAARKAAKGPKKINIEDAELYSTEMLKNKIRNPHNNIKMSGRSKKKVLKRLKNNLRDEQRKAESECPGKNKDFVKDFFMNDAEDTKDDPKETTQKMDEIPSSSSQPSSGAATTTEGKKKKQRGRKKRKGKGDAGGEGDDVEMEEL